MTAPDFSALEGQVWTCLFGGGCVVDFRITNGTFDIRWTNPPHPGEGKRFRRILKHFRQWKREVLQEVANEIGWPIRDVAITPSGRVREELIEPRTTGKEGDN